MPWGAAGRKSDSGGGDEAVLLEQFQPARRVACNRNGFEVGGRVPVVRLSADQQEDCFEDFVSACDDGALMPSSQAKCLEPGLEGASRPTGRVRELAKQASDLGIAFSYPSGLALAGGLVVAGTNTHPGGQSINRAKGAHVIADLDQQQGGTHGVDAGDGLHMSRIDHCRDDADLLQRRMRTLPVDAGALHDHHLGAVSSDPLRHRLTVTLESAELGQLDTRLASLIFRDRTGRDLRLMNVQPDDPLVQFRQFHPPFLSRKVTNGWKRRLTETTCRVAPAAFLPCALHEAIRGTSRFSGSC